MSIGALPRTDAEAVGRPRRRAAGGRLPLVPALVVIAMFLPEAFGFIVGDFRLTPDRIVFLALSPVMLIAFARLLGSPGYRFVWSDLFTPLAAFWMLFALSQTEGFGAALKSAGVAALEVLAPYLLIRSTLRNAQHAHAVVRLFCILAAFAGVVAIADTVARTPIVHDSLARLTGYTYFGGEGLRNLADDYRLGLFRAAGIFEHPILLGITMCYALLLSRDLTGGAKLWCRVGCGTGLFFCLSSAPWQGFVLGCFLVLLNRIFTFPRRWLLLVATLIFSIITIFMSTTNPLGWIFSHFTLDPSTGYFRLLIWQYAGQDVLQSPYVGIGLHDWFRPDWMPSSVDAFWLREAMLYGIPGSVLMALSLIGSCSISVRRTAANAAQIGEREVRLSETIGIIVFLTVWLGFTVHFWGIVSLAQGMLAGLRACLGQFAAGAHPVGATRSHRAGPSGRYASG